VGAHGSGVFVPSHGSWRISLILANDLAEGRLVAMILRRVSVLGGPWGVSRRRAQVWRILRRQRIRRPGLPVFVSVCVDVRLIRVGVSHRCLPRPPGEGPAPRTRSHAMSGRQGNRVHHPVSG